MTRYKLVLWGTGKRAESCLKERFLEKHEIIGVVDTYKKTEKFHDIDVYEPEELPNLMETADYLVVLTQYHGEILKQCWDMKISLDRIIISDNVKGMFFSDCFERLKLLSEEFYQQASVEELRLMDTNLSDRVDAERILGQGKYASGLSATDYMRDYYRFRTFEFVAREIKNKGLRGAVAELGVFRGRFASLINETFPDKRFYLFDTFESFDPKEYEKEKAMGRCGKDNVFWLGHVDTSVEMMMANIPHPGSCVVCKGLFPSSVTKEAENENYSFVSLDVDLEESTYQGLKFFYPRLEEFGYIFLHDYTTHWLQGVKQAVERYEKDAGVELKKVPIADRGGTLIITK